LSIFGLLFRRINLFVAVEEVRTLFCITLVIYIR
jgi:hypothetical protein